MKIYSECIPIRDPRFMDFVERIGMVEAWERFGWPDLIPIDPRKPR